jgi:hypothetical protein
VEEVGKAKQAHWMEFKKKANWHIVWYIPFSSALSHALALTDFMRLRHSTENCQRCRSQCGRQLLAESV